VFQANGGNSSGRELQLVDRQMGGGTDVALETADITLMTSDLSRLTEIFSIAKNAIAFSIVPALGAFID
jgi:cation transport ATPase